MPSKVGAVLDTSYLIDMAYHSIDAMVAGAWLNRNSIAMRIPWSVKCEYNRYLAQNPPALNRAGIPKAPIDLKEILHRTRDSYSDWSYSTDDLPLMHISDLSSTDKVVVKEARTIAEKRGQCYILTNDKLLAETSNGYKIDVLDRRTIEEKCSDALPAVGIRMIFPASILAGLYNLGSSGSRERHYVLSERRKDFVFGRHSINVEYAKELVLLEKGQIPSRSNEHGIAVAVVDQVDENSVAEAIIDITGGRPRPMNVIFLQKAKKFLPYLARFGFEKKGSYYVERLWAMKQ
jgi:hypothetical protein